MDLKVGTLLDGKVKSITKFGAFVTIPENRTGMVHISEVSNRYVQDIREHLTEGQSVRVKVMGIDEAGKISLSIKRAEETHEPPKVRRDSPRPTQPAGPMSFEEKLKQFMSDSDSKISGCALYERRSKSSRRR